MLVFLVSSLLSGSYYGVEQVFGGQERSYWLMVPVNDIKLAFYLLKGQLMYVKYKGSEY